MVILCSVVYCKLFMSRWILLNAYIFVAAAILAVIPVLILVKVNVNKLIDDPEQFNYVQKRFFIGMALSKVIPAILLVVGIVNLTPVNDYSDLYLPWGIIVITVLYGIHFITAQKNINVGKQERLAINTLVSIARPMVLSIPLMAAIFLFMMTIE